MRVKLASTEHSSSIRTPATIPEHCNAAAEMELEVDGWNY